MSQTNQVFILTFALILLGHLLKRRGVVSETEGKVLSKLLMNSTFPALIFVSMSQIQLTASLALLPFIIVIVGLIMLGLGWNLLKKYPNKQRGVLMMGLGAFNTGMFGFPIFEGLFGKEGLGYAILLDLGVVIMVFGASYPIAASFSELHDNSNKKKLIKKIITTPPLVASILGLIINLLSIEIPTMALDILTTLGKGNKVLVLLLIGIYLKFDYTRFQLKAISKVLTVRYLVGILASVLAYYFTPSSQEILRNVHMLCMVLPVGTTILPFSDELDLDTPLGGGVLNMSFVVSFVLMWSIMLIV